MSKRAPRLPLISETLGGISKPAVDLLYRLHTTVSPTAAQDSTVYGTSRSATHSFHAHHLRLLSLDAHRQNMALLLAGADRENRRCTERCPPPPTLQAFIPVHVAPDAPAAPSPT